MNWSVYYKEKTLSVMDEVRCLAEDGHDQGAVIVAKTQVSGRGRQGREWFSPLGGLYSALLLRPSWALEDAPKLTLMSAVAACEAVREHTHLAASIKWPNDLLIGADKVAGILVESPVQGQKLSYAVVGIGLNVNTPAEDLPSGAVSLKQFSSRDYNLDDVLNAVLERVAFWYQETHQNGFQGLIGRWKELCGIFDRKVRFHDGKKDAIGTACDIADDGALMVRCEDGSVVCRNSGEVFFDMY